MVHNRIAHGLGIAILLVSAACLVEPSHLPQAVAQEDRPAVQADPTEKKKDGEGPFGNFLIPMMLIMAAFFFLIILPAQRKEKKQREMIMTTLKKNDEVVTASGIIGIVHTIKDNADEVTLKIDDNARMRVLKSSIVRIVTKEEAKDAAATPPASTDVKPA